MSVLIPASGGSRDPVAPEVVPTPGVGGVSAVGWPAAVAASVWRGDQFGHAQANTLSSGFVALDAELPGGGWPCRGLTELLLPLPGVLEWRLLAPALRALAQPRPGTAGASVLLVGPPHCPHPPGLKADGLHESAWVWLQADTPADRLWTTEQLIKAHWAGAILVWLPQVRPQQLRRLQVLASGAARGPVFVCRPQAAAAEASAAPLRLRVGLGPGWTVRVEVLKRPGPPLLRALELCSVPAGLVGLVSPGQAGQEPPAQAPSPPTWIREDGHGLVRSAADRSTV